MANHGYVYANKELVVSDVKRDMDKINHKFFNGLLTVEELNGDFWIHSDMILPNGISFWISSEYEYGYMDGDEFVEHDKPKLVCKDSVLEFRHGHGGAVHWWLEGVFRDNFAKMHNYLVGDDGYEGRFENESHIFETYWKYIKHNKFAYVHRNEKKLVKEFYKEVDKRNRSKKLKRILNES